MHSKDENHKSHTVAQSRGATLTTVHGIEGTRHPAQLYGSVMCF